ncbi:hypothetical protein [Xanthomonas vesicatoria]|nr:hypothetical protein [Xanthomonas vesicatoria]
MEDEEGRAMRGLLAGASYVTDVIASPLKIESSLLQDASLGT